MVQLRREWRRLREQQLASYLQQRINNDDAFGQAASLLGLLSVKFCFVCELQFKTVFVDYVFF